MKDTRSTSWDVAIWGTYPPPYGGMATHIVRLLHRLEREGLVVRVFNRSSDGEDPPRAISIRHRQKRWFLHFALTAPDRLLYVFTGRPLVRFLAYLLKVCRGKKYILRIGEEAIFETFRSGSRTAKWMTGVACRHADHIVAVSPHFVDLVRSLGVPDERIHVIPGFIAPPDLTEEPLAETIAFAKAHSPVLSANGQLVFLWGEDLYGFHLLIDALPEIKRRYPNFGLLISLYGMANVVEGVDDFTAKLRDLGLADNVLIRSDPHRFWPVLKYCDVFVRPTRSEGDSGSIREAISLGVPIVASDATPRPEPTVLFANGDANDLQEKLLAVLADLHTYKRRFAEATLGDNAQPIIDLMKNTLNR